MTTTTEDSWPPEGVEAYHKANYVAVLGRPEAVAGLFRWVLKFDAHNNRVERRAPDVQTLSSMMSDGREATSVKA